MVHRFITIWNKTNLIKRISIGIGIGVLLAIIFPQAQAIGLLGQIFVGGLKAIAPLLVFALVANALSQQQKGQKSNMKTVILLYLLGTFAAALVAVLVNFFFPISIELASSSQKVSPPDGIGQVLSNLLLQLVDNPYPLVWRCLRVSGVTVFFTRSSAANIPVNMKLCRDLGLNPETYSVSIPLGATINMAGAAITINTLTLAAVNTLGIRVDFGTALVLSIVAAISACGASGVAGGSLLLIPVACSLFGISNDLAMQVVSVGFVIGVIQDSCETALNSSTDVLFTAVAEMSSWPKEKRY